jgi:hypothetical protein
LHDPHSFPDEVDRLDVGNQHAGAAQHLPKRLNDVGNSHVARGDFVQHVCEEHEILFRRQHDFSIW